ncbi:collagen triple helix repeat domain protein [Acidisarcina polymorpha]|uniref:Collagen triple helix repeat domain protein n=1 Tax=Acidisarcina polymorpha TaxID=2211140 RepID=A0A2Z5FV69_9BACT|nr:YncE family protein [Acidisarcina polymorpha]AXC10783.1 collagen triple helix repeat domain protein [Acidisarcina polymorpha]
MKFARISRLLGRSFAVLAAVVSLQGNCMLAAAQAGTYHVEQTWKLGGDGGWDYLKVDEAAHLLYITRGARVMVVDLQSGKVLGEITGLQGTHGVAFDSAGKLGYISDGGAGMVRVFDRATRQVVNSVPVGKNPDAILYEPTKKYVFAFNGRSNDASVIDTSSNQVIATIPLSGKPEFAQTDGKGTVFVNIEDKNDLVRIDAATLKVTATWPLAPCESPSGLAIDPAKRRLFSVCDGKKMAITDADSGKVVATPEIGDGPDAAGFDSQRALAFSSNGEGTLTIVHQDSADSYSVLQTVPTKRGARTMALDPSTGKVYLVTADFGPKPTPTADNPRPRPAILPGTFSVIVVSP